MKFGGGGDIMEQNWTRVHSDIDLVNSWKASGHSLPQDACTCTSSLEDGAVFTGCRVYGLLENVGNSETKVAWQNVSIGSIYGKARCLHARNMVRSLKQREQDLKTKIKFYQDGITVNIMC